MKRTFFLLILSTCSIMTMLAQDTDSLTAVPFEGLDLTWQHGNDRRTNAVLQGKYFTGSVMIDANYSYSFNDPIDNTVIGSTAISRDNEVEISYAGLGGDFYYENAHARIMTQFGSRTSLVPRTDLTHYRGQYELANMYRYLSEGYAGYHFNKWYGINVDIGTFLSYLGLSSYYQTENWVYQSSLTTDNTPWYFNGLRIQAFPTRKLKVEAWIINGWQSYGKFNTMPGLGTSLTWCPNENLKLVTNDYYGTDAVMIKNRIRFHSDNSILVRYVNNKESKGLSQAAFSITGDIGFESGGGVSGFNGDAAHPSQYFLSTMVLHRLWFHKNAFAWTLGGGWMTNPGRYLVLAPVGDASPLPNPYNPTQTSGTHPFSANPGDPFSGWDVITNIDWLPNQSFTARLEYVHRHSNVPYFVGHGGVTSPTGYTTTPIPAGWLPDLVKGEDRIVFAFLFRL